MIDHINIKAVQKEMRDFNFDTIGYTFDIPFLILQGESNIITPVESAKNFTKRIQAPKKDFATISHAGHLAEFCNPHEFIKRVRSFTSSQD